MRIRQFFLFFILIDSLFISSLCFGQNAGDKDRIKETDFKNESFNKKKKVSFLFTESKNIIFRYNPLSLSFGGMMYVYQKFISVQIGANCPYEISCSAFSKKCINEFGLIKGVALSADRLMRCTRLASVDLTYSEINEDTQHIIDHPENYSSSKKMTPGQEN